jgi:predicted HicB family RNase H-like nuclease
MITNGKGVNMPEIQEKLKAVRLDLTEEEHRALRVEAAKAGMSMSAFVKQLVLKQIKGKAK